MPKISAEKLETIAATLLMRSGSSEEEATIIARHSITANLAGPQEPQMANWRNIMMARRV